MNKILENYRLNLEKETKLKVPKFDHLSAHTAKILAVLQDPGHSGAEVSGVCSIDNNDPTANKQKKILENLTYLYLIHKTHKNSKIKHLIYQCLNFLKFFFVY